MMQLFGTKLAILKKELYPEMKRSILFLTLICSALFTCLNAFTPVNNAAAIVQDVLTGLNTLVQAMDFSPRL